MLATVVLATAPAVARAQAGSLLLAEGIKAYQALDFAAAAELLGRALDARGPRGLSSADQQRALMYLGAVHIFRDERNDAVAAFRRLILTDPRFHPDTLVFPPRVTGSFADVRQTTKAITLAAPTAIRFRARAEAFPVRAYATSRHRIDARIEASDGRLLARLYRGPIGDSTTLAWNGLDASGDVPPAGTYRLVVTSMLSPNQVLRSVSIPLELRVEPLDTVPWPAASEVPRSGWDVRFLVPGLVLGAGLAVPAALGVGGVRGPRIAVGLTIGAIGVIGASRAAGRATSAAEADWRRRVADARADNARRRREPMVVLRVGPPRRAEGGG